MGRKINIVCENYDSLKFLKKIKIIKWDPHAMLIVDSTSQ